MLHLFRKGLSLKNVRKFSLITSPRKQAEFEQLLMNSLRTVSDPLLSNLQRAPDIVSQGLVSRIDIDEHQQVVDINIVLPTAAHFGRDELKERCSNATINALPWVKNTNINFTQTIPQYISAAKPGLRVSTGVKTKEATPPALKNVGAVIAVASCKGGVGKSTVASNLAWAIAERGGRVGLLDLDVYGPSLPTLLENAVEKSENGRPIVKRSREHEGMILPIQCHGGVSAMSFGWVNPKAGVKGAGGTEAAVVRGPIASKVVTQLLLSTEWGHLDYLILDLPPGTGDVHLTVAQLLRLSGAVVVTTPSSLSHVDVLKGVAMYEQLKVPTLAVIENFAYLDLPSGDRIHPFGMPGRHKQSLQEALPNCRDEDLDGQLPISDIVRDCTENGETLIQRLKKTNNNGVEEEVRGNMKSEPAYVAFQEMADKVIRRVYEESCIAIKAPSVIYNEKRGGFVVRWTEHMIDGGDAAQEVVISPHRLRYSDPSTGSKLPNTPGGSSEEDSVIPLSVDVRGNYALHIKWSDGFEHAFFTYDAILTIAHEDA